MNQTRLYQIDALRGFALFGIFIVNIFVFHAPYAHYSAFYLPFEGMDAAVVENMIFFFGGKFMFIYAFLFGYSFWIQYEKFQDKKAFKTYWNKRMIGLAIFGILHILLLSFGDILLPYALLGLSLPFFAKQNRKQLIGWFLLINLIPLYEFVLSGMVDLPSFFIQPAETLEGYIRINGEGNFFDIMVLRLKDYFSFGNEKLIHYIPKEMSLFLLGIMAAQSKLATHLKRNQGLLFCAFALCIIGAMYFYRPAIIGAFDYENSIVQRIAIGLIIHFSEFIHGLLYIVGFFMLWKSAIIRKGLHALTYTGKLSLSNYIMQSFICAIIFSGFGYYGKLTPVDLVIYATVIYLFQLLFSYLWLKKYNYGPLEALWRKYSKN